MQALPQGPPQQQYDGQQQGRPPFQRGTGSMPVQLFHQSQLLKQLQTVEQMPQQKMPPHQSNPYAPAFQLLVRTI